MTHNLMTDLTITHAKPLMIITYARPENGSAYAAPYYPIKQDIFVANYILSISVHLDPIEHNIEYNDPTTYKE